MTPEQIRSVVLGSSELKLLAREGCDGELALRPELSEVVTKEYRLTSLRVLDLFGPIRGAAIMAGIRQAAQQNPVLAEIVPHMDSYGVNVGHVDAPTVFELLVGAGICSREEADIVLDLAKHTVFPTVTEVSRALRVFRPDGKVGKYSSEELS